MSERLGPCRKCGGAGVFCCSSDGEAEWIRCQNCGYESAVHYKLEEVLASWNAPAPAANSTDPAPIDEIGSHIGNGGQFDPTDPTLRLAREIAADLFAYPLRPREKWIAGDYDGTDAVRAALAGILRASEMALRKLDECCDPCLQCHDAIENFEHLKG